MPFCPKCERPFWPFLMILTITSVIACLTWLILGLSAFDPVARLLVAVGVFVAVGATLLHYVLSCLRRHCRHRQPAAHGSS